MGEGVLEVGFGRGRAEGFLFSEGHAIILMVFK